MRDILERHTAYYCAEGKNRGVCIRDRKRAIAEAREVRAKMKTKGWRVRVFENLGWHWNLFNGYITLSGDGCGVTKSVKYSAMMADSLPPGGSPNFWYPGPGKGYFKDPNKAVDYVFKSAKQFVREVHSVVEKQERFLSLIKK